MNKRAAGFTLIELMIVVAIIGILAAIAYPAYQEQVRKARRSDGQAMLMDAMAKQERYYTDHNTYTTTLTALGYSVADNAPSSEEFYLLHAEECVAGAGVGSCVKLSATAQGAQAPDGNLTLDSTGARNGNW